MAQRLEDVLFGPVPGDDRFRVDDEQKLAWALRKLGEAEKEIEKLTKQRDEWIAKINMWFGESVKEHVNTAERMKGLIQEYHMNELAKNPKRKTIKHPLGTLSARKTTKYVTDDEIFIKWAKENGHEQLIRVKEEPNKKDMGKYVEVTDKGEVFSVLTGELIPGVKAEQEISFSVKTTKEESE